MVQLQWTEKKNLLWWTATNKLHSNVQSINQYSLVQNVATISYNLPDIPATREPEGKFSPSMPWRDSEEKSDSNILNFGTTCRRTASRLGCFTQRERALSTHWIGGRPGCNFLRWGGGSCHSQNSTPHRPARSTATSPTLSRLLMWIPSPFLVLSTSNPRINFYKMYKITKQSGVQRGQIRIITLQAFKVFRDDSLLLTLHISRSGPKVENRKFKKKTRSHLKIIRARRVTEARSVPTTHKY